MKKKRTFSKIFCTMQIFSELSLVDDSVDFLELSEFINASLP